MKIIDLLNERAKMFDEKGRINLTVNSLFPSTNRTEEENKVYREFQDRVKRYNELSDRINKAYAQTKIKVTGYGEMCLATAIEYLRERIVPLEDEDGILSFLLATDFQKDMTRLALFDLEKGCIKASLPFSAPCDEDNEKSKEKRTKVNEWNRITYNDLQTAILVAIVETEA